MARRGRWRRSNPDTAKEGPTVLAAWNDGTATRLVAGGQFLRTAQGFQANGVEELVGGGAESAGQPDGVGRRAPGEVVSWCGTTAPARRSTSAARSAMSVVSARAANGIARWDGNVIGAARRPRHRQGDRLRRRAGGVQRRSGMPAASSPWRTASRRRTWRAGTASTGRLWVRHGRHRATRCAPGTAGSTPAAPSPTAPSRRTSRSGTACGAASRRASTACAVERRAGDPRRGAGGVRRRSLRRRQLRRGLRRGGERHRAGTAPAGRGSAAHRRRWTRSRRWRSTTTARVRSLPGRLLARSGVACRPRRTWRAGTGPI